VLRDPARGHARGQAVQPREFRILASQVVVDMFLEEESQHLAMLGDFIGKPVSLQVQSDYQQEQYDIILM
jgi:ribonuclease G